MSFPVPLPSTFMPLPLAIMIPFMGIQSGVMAQQFGMNFQYGKRKISAMSNEEFNKLTPQQMQLDFSNQITGMIPTFEKSLQEMRPFQRMIFIEMIAAFKEAVQLGLDIAGAGLGINTGLPSIPKDKFTPGEEEIARGAPRSVIPKKQVTKITDTRRRNVQKQPVRGVTQKDVSVQGLRRAGQTQKLERDKLIQIISKQAKDVRTIGISHNRKQQLTNQLKNTEIKLRKLLASYNWR